MINLTYVQWFKAVVKWRKIIKHLHDGELAKAERLAFNKQCPYCARVLDRLSYLDQTCNLCPLKKRMACNETLINKQAYAFWRFDTAADFAQDRQVALTEANKVFNAIWADGVRLGHCERVRS